MTSPNSEHDNGQQRLDAMLVAYLEAAERPDTFDHRQWVRRYPQFASELNTLLDGCTQIDKVTAPLRAIAQSADLPAEEERLGDYRIVREIGRGGMGVVYEAEQISLRRRVALKVLPFAAILDDRQLRRFENEALAAGSLKHPNIVSVYGVGCERAVHFYAMELVDGQNLASLISDLKAQVESKASTSSAHQGLTDAAGLSQTTGPSPASSGTSAFYPAVAKLCLQAADALEYAHQSGVVHRDIKPANLLVDGSGKLWITDFGLAQFHTETTLTLTGDFFGTLRYMSPEQAAGHRGKMDHRTDIYSLAATFYEAVTLRHAFQADDRQQLLRRIIECEPRPPRQINPAIPKDLETILLKALSKEPQDRYESAGELADDLRRFLEKKPIRARRSTSAERLWRWCRRSPLTATLITAVGLLLLILAIAGPLLAVRQARLARAYQLQEKRANEKSQQLRGLVDTMLTETAQQLEWIPGTEPVRRDLLDKALDFYKTFLDTESTDPSVRHQAARAWQRVAGIDAMRGDKQRARDAYGRSIAMLTDLSRRSPDVTAYVVDLAETNLRSEYFDCLAYDERVSAGQTAVSLYGDLVAQHPNRRDYQRGHAIALLELGISLRLADKLSDAEICFQQSLVIWSELADARDPTVDELAGAMKALTAYSKLLRNSYRFAEADKLLEQESALRQQALSRYADDRSAIRFSIGGAGARADLLSLMGRQEEAVTYYRRSIHHFEHAVHSYPHHVKVRELCGMRYRELSNPLLAIGRLEDAEKALRQSLGYANEIADRFPDDRCYDLELGTVYYRLGTLLHSERKFDDSKAAFEEALKRFETYVEAFPSRTGSSRRLVILLATCPDAGFRDPGRAVRLARRSAEQASENGRWWHLLGVAEYEAGQFQDAIASLRQGMQRRAGGDSFDRLFLAMAHWQVGEKQEARRWYQQALEYIDHDGRTISRDFTPLDAKRIRAEARQLIGD